MEAHSLLLAALWAEAQLPGGTGTDMVVDHWSLSCWANGTASLGPSSPPELCGDKCGPVATEAGLLPQQEEDEPPGRG